MKKYGVFRINIRHLLCIIIYCFIGCQSTNVNNQWQIIYRHNKIGERIEGDKEKLIAAIRNGCDLRIGWGVQGTHHTIEHCSEPIWLAILDGQEVSAHLDPQTLSNIQWDSLISDYSNPNKLRQEWRVVLNTNGSFDAVWYDKSADTLIQRRPQQHPMTWFVRACDPDLSTPALFETDK